MNTIKLRPELCGTLDTIDRTSDSEQILLGNFVLNGTEMFTLANEQTSISNGQLYQMQRVHQEEEKPIELEYLDRLTQCYNICFPDQGWFGAVTHFYMLCWCYLKISIIIESFRRKPTAPSITVDNILSSTFYCNIPHTAIANSDAR